MATGAPGTNGVWQYGEDDSEATFSALLNKVASTADASIGTDRNRITVLENVKPGTSGKPFQVSAGSVTTSTTANVTVTFPSSRFTVAPMVNVTSVAGTNAVCTPYVASVNATSMTLSLYTTAGSRVAQQVQWSAIQMTSSSGAG